jgi:PAS domain S-box-containing protein
MNDTYNMTSSDQWEHLLFNENPLIIVQYDTDLNILACNKMMEEIAGEQWKKVVGLNLKSLKEQRILPAAEAALRGEKGHYEGEYISHYQNKKFWIKLNTVPLPDQNNKIVGGLAFMHNLTEFNQIKNDLQIQKSFFENLFESSPDAITILDPDDRVLQINKPFTTLFGFNEDEVIGRQSMTS